jgi:hypothetical protein
LALQPDIGALQGVLTEEQWATFAGLWIENEPTYRVVAAFTSPGEETIRKYVAGTPLATVVETAGASYTLKELRDAQTKADAIANAVGVRHHTGIDVINNHAELYVLDAAGFASSARREALELPSQVRVVEVPKLATPVADIYGGLHLDRAGGQAECTSGFSVQITETTKGVTTAGHCWNDLFYNGTAITFEGGTTGGVYDLQWHSTPGFTVHNWIWDGTYTRYIFDKKFRANQTVGETVCKYGRTTGGGCGSILQTDFDGVNVATNISVQGGDSGGPFFMNNVAYGTTISSWGNNSVYGPVDHIYGFGLSVLTN